MNIHTTQTEEWGNIELPGLSDKELFTKNWNRSQSEKDKWKDAEHRKRMTELRRKTSQDPAYIEKHRQSMQKIQNSQEYRENYLSAMKRLQNNEQWRKNQKEASDIIRNDPKWKEQKRQEMLNNLKDKEFQTKRILGVRKAYENPELIHKLKEQRKHQKKEVQTPDGIFESRKAAAEFYNIDPTQINYRIKKYPKEYFYIEKNIKQK